ncbi:hypothetical protein Tco_0778166 [Tanacetum coccineum]
MGTAVKTSAGCVWRKTTLHSNTNSGPTPDSNVHDHPLKHMEHRGIFDSGCSGHMTGNRAHLEDYQELNKVGSVTLEEVKEEDALPHVVSSYISFLKNEGILKRLLIKIKGLLSDINNLPEMRSPITTFQTRSSLMKITEAHALESLRTLEDGSWGEAMQEELCSSSFNKVGFWFDLPKPMSKVIVLICIQETKRMSREVVRNKARLTYQIDVKSAFLYGTIDEDVYVSQSLLVILLILDILQRVSKEVKACRDYTKPLEAWKIHNRWIVKVLGQRRLTSWQCQETEQLKPLSTTEAEYVAAAGQIAVDKCKVKTGNHLILVLNLGVEKVMERSTWTGKAKCQLSLANWYAIGCQLQPSADPTPSQSVPATSSSHVQIYTTTSTLTHSWYKPPPQPSSVQPTATTPPTQPVQTTSSPPVSTIPDIQPTLPPSPQIPSPSYHDTEGPSFEPSYHMSPPPSHEPEIQASRSSEEILKEQGFQGGQEEQIKFLPSTLEAAQILTNVASEGFKGSQAPLGSKIYRRKPKSKPTPTKILHFEEPDESQVNTAQVNTAEVDTAALNTETQRQIDLDALLARRLVEQEEEAAREALATEFDYIQVD